MSKTGPTWVSIETAAERLGCNPKTVRRYIARGDIRAYRLGPRLVRVDLNELDKMLRPIPSAGGDAA